MKLMLIAFLLFVGVCFGHQKPHDPPKLPNKHYGVSLKDLRKIKIKHPKLSFPRLYEKALKKKYRKTIKRINKYIDILKKTLKDKG